MASLTSITKGDYWKNKLLLLRNVKHLDMYVGLAQF
jgi:hypothetical protein